MPEEKDPHRGRKEQGGGRKATMGAANCNLDSG